MKTISRLFWLVASIVDDVLKRRRVYERLNIYLKKLFGLQ
jgi:hypothetical protein